MKSLRVIFFVLCAILIVSVFAFILSGCGNKQVFDTTYTFDEAIIALPDGRVVSGKVDSWSDYEGDQLQVKIDGVTYLTFASNIVLIRK